MTESVEEAMRRVEAARAKLNEAIEKVASALEILMRESLNKTVEKIVIGQGEVTNSMDPAELAVLKVNIVNGIDSAVSGVRGAIIDVDLEKRSERARPNSTGDSFIRIGSVLTPLVQGVTGLLANAGYNLSSLRGGRGSHGQITFGDLEDGFVSEQVARDLDSATERLGKAKYALKEAEQRVASDKARSAWDNA